MQDLTTLALLLPVLLVSMMAHEVAHGYVAFRLGDPTAKRHGRLSANPLRHLDPLGTFMFVATYLFGGFIFGWAKPVPVNPGYFQNQQRGMMLVGFAGPATNFVAAVLLAQVLNLLTPGLDTLAFRVLFLGYQVNVVLGIFNLVPIPPLDGSRLVGGLLSPASYRRWVELDRYGIIFIMLIFFVFRGPFFTVLETAFRAVSRVLLPSYAGLM